MYREHSDAFLTEDGAGSFSFRRHSGVRPSGVDLADEKCRHLTSAQTATIRASIEVTQRSLLARHSECRAVISSAVPSFVSRAAIRISAMWTT